MPNCKLHAEPSDAWQQNMRHNIPRLLKSIDSPSSTMKSLDFSHPRNLHMLKVAEKRQALLAKMLRFVILMRCSLCVWSYIKSVLDVVDLYATTHKHHINLEECAVAAMMSGIDILERQNDARADRIYRFLVHATDFRRASIIPLQVYITVSTEGRIPKASSYMYIDALYNHLCKRLKADSQARTSVHATRPISGISDSSGSSDGSGSSGGLGGVCPTARNTVRWSTRFCRRSKDSINTKHDNHTNLDQVNPSTHSVMYSGTTDTQAGRAAHAPNAIRHADAPSGLKTTAEHARVVRSIHHGLEHRQATYSMKSVDLQREFYSDTSSSFSLCSGSDKNDLRTASVQTASHHGRSETTQIESNILSHQSDRPQGSTCYRASNPGVTTSLCESESIGPPHISSADACNNDIVPMDLDDDDDDDVEKGDTTTTESVSNRHHSSSTNCPSHHSNLCNSERWCSDSQPTLQRTIRALRALHAVSLRICMHLEICTFVGLQYNAVQVAIIALALTDAVMCQITETEIEPTRMKWESLETIADMRRCIANAKYWIFFLVNTQSTNEPPTQSSPRTHQCSFTEHNSITSNTCIVCWARKHMIRVVQNYCSRVWNYQPVVEALDDKFPLNSCLQWSHVVSGFDKLYQIVQRRVEL